MLLADLLVTQLTTKLARAKDMRHKFWCEKVHREVKRCTWHIMTEEGGDPLVESRLSSRVSQFALEISKMEKRRALHEKKLQIVQKQAANDTKKPQREESAESELVVEAPGSPLQQFRPTTPDSAPTHYEVQQNTTPGLPDSLHERRASFFRLVSPRGEPSSPKEKAASCEDGYQTDMEQEYGWEQGSQEDGPGTTTSGDVLEEDDTPADQGGEVDEFEDQSEPEGRDKLGASGGEFETNLPYYGEFEPNGGFEVGVESHVEHGRKGGLQPVAGPSTRRTTAISGDARDLRQEEEESSSEVDKGKQTRRNYRDGNEGEKESSEEVVVLRKPIRPASSTKKGKRTRNNRRESVPSEEEKPPRNRQRRSSQVARPRRTVKDLLKSMQMST